MLSRKPKGIRVAGLDDIRPGEKKEITVGEEKLLLVKVRGYLRVSGFSGGVSGFDVLHVAVVCRPNLAEFMCLDQSARECEVF